jgi:hypothetical protein
MKANSEIKSIHTTAGGYRLEAFKRSDTTRAPEPFCCLVYSPRGALVLGAAGAGDSLIEALVDGAFMAGCHQTAMTIRKAAEKPSARVTSHQERVDADGLEAVNNCLRNAR